MILKYSDPRYAFVRLFDKDNKQIGFVKELNTETKKAIIEDKDGRREVDASEWTIEIRKGA